MQQSLIFFAFFIPLIIHIHAEYWEEREDLLLKERRISTGGQIILTEVEQQANQVLMKYKEQEWESGFNHPSNFPLLKDIRLDLSASPIFKIIEAMPKGALLHVHLYGMASQAYIFNITYHEDLYVCNNKDNELQFKFLNVPDDTCKWERVQDKREKNPFFDDYLQSKLSIVRDFPYRDNLDILDNFYTIENLILPIILYRPVFQDYFWQCLLELYNDNVRYAEIRFDNYNLYDLEETVNNYTLVETCQFIVNNFQETYPDFLGVKMIYSPDRRVSNEVLQGYVDTYFELKQKHGDFISGFDLVGEDRAHPLKNFVPVLLPVKDNIDFYLHAGQTNWLGCDIDENLVDALLLGTKRIGEAVALAKHPKLMQLAKETGVAIEVSPISDIAMGLVQDIRNHPAAMFSVFGVNYVIVNGVPAFWGTCGLSYDYYAAFMGMASKKDDLKYLKKLAMNSLAFSAIEDSKKSAALDAWLDDWDEFVEKLAKDEIR